jgi:hypothetical protein
MQCGPVDHRAEIQVATRSPSRGGQLHLTGNPRHRRECQRLNSRCRSATSRLAKSCVMKRHTPPFSVASEQPAAQPAHPIANPRRRGFASGSSGENRRHLPPSTGSSARARLTVSNGRRLEPASGASGENPRHLRRRPTHRHRAGSPALGQLPVSDRPGCAPATALPVKLGDISGAVATRCAAMANPHLRRCRPNRHALPKCCQMRGSIIAR